MRQPWMNGNEKRVSSVSLWFILYHGPDVTVFDGVGCAEYTNSSMRIRFFFVARRAALKSDPASGAGFFMASTLPEAFPVCTS